MGMRNPSIFFTGTHAKPLIELLFLAILSKGILRGLLPLLN